MKLIRKYLTSGIMINGIKVKSEEGTPQEGPLSLLLFNILLDEMDKNLKEGDIDSVDMLLTAIYTLKI